ncbi:putative membrane protein [Salirhabdus euzebyi]|uniref:Putative membrane protein n=1 Tax=Salirhabdus euzebyi TaxID=394506 RepID=A0A841Q615_9BACI|nr:DUF1700 domain-containing protein [Salirhabdus euzebyi]MBB6453814.1 putative membrane protein [Salirhabdus euzebyi]
MNKQLFLKELERQLAKVPEYDRKEMIYDFEEHFELGEAEGKTEEEIVKDLGSPRVIAKDLLIDYRVTQAETDKSVKNISQAVIATIGLSFFNLIIMLGPIVAIIGVYVGLSAAAIALTLSPFAWIVSLFFDSSNALLGFFVSITVSSLGVLFSVGMIYVGKFLYHIILKYVKFNIRIIKGGNA